MRTEVPREVAEAFKERMALRLDGAGAALERHFPALAHGGGLSLLRQSYALILGLWQMSSVEPGRGRSGRASCELDALRYPDELARALRALWTGTLQQAEAAGATPVGGMDMFIRQAARQFEIWTSKPAPMEAMRRATRMAT